jgi:AI-2 transport protein TqsA
VTTPAEGPEHGGGPPPDHAAGREPGLPRALIALRATAAAVIVGAGIQATAWLVGPVFLALVIVITVHPVHALLQRVGLPSWAATTVLVLVVYGVLLVLAGVVVVSVARLATVLPSYAGEANALVTRATTTLARFGVGIDQIRALAATLNYGRVVGVVGGLLLGVTSLLGNLVFLLSLLLFLSIEASGASARLALIADDRAPIAEALTGFTRATRRYIGVNTVFGLATGLVDAVALGLLGVPLALLWGLLVFITNYIPYLGFWIALVPPVLLALLTGGWQLAAMVFALFTVVNFVLTSLIQPKYVGDAVGISVTVTLVALVLWGWLLGTIGAVLAIPLTLLVKALLVDVDPRARWANALLGSTGTTRRLRAMTAPPNPLPRNGSLPADGTGPADPSAATALRDAGGRPDGP